MTIHLVTFSDESMSRARDLCVESALRHGVQGTNAFCPASVIDFCERPELMRERGLGHWRWKPRIINEVLRNDYIDGDILIYSDAGVEFINNVSHIIERMDQDIFLFGNNWEHAHWCKRDVIESIWPCPKRDIPYFVSDGTQGMWEGVDVLWTRFGRQVQASVIFFRVSDYTREFVAEWLKWCLFEGGRLIDDSPSRLPNHPEFREHRHDQAILTTMAYREGIKLHYWPAVYNKGGTPEFIYEQLREYAGDDYPILFHHHRKRNHEWKQVA